MFLPLATPGFGMLGAAIASALNGVYSTIEVIAVVLGIAVVALAALFTIRANVAKVWKDLAEGEKARNTELIAEMAQARLETAEQLAQARLDFAAQLAVIQAEAASQRELKHQALADLAAANMRTDLTPLIGLVSAVRDDLSGRLDRIEKTTDTV